MQVIDRASCLARLYYKSSKVFLRNCIMERWRSATGDKAGEREKMSNDNRHLCCMTEQQKSWHYPVKVMVHTFPLPQVYSTHVRHRDAPPRSKRIQVELNRSHMLGHTCWATLAGPHLLGHTGWATPAGPYLLGHTCWATPAGPHLLGNTCWATTAGPQLLGNLLLLTCCL